MQRGQVPCVFSWTSSLQSHTLLVSYSTCVCMQIEQLNAKVAELQAQSWQATNCRSELELLKAS